jgi:hypothetical protein
MDDLKDPSFQKQSSQFGPEANPIKTFYGGNLVCAVISCGARIDI